MVNYSTMKIKALFSFETLVSIPEDVNIHFVRIARFIPGRRTGAIYVGRSESNVSYLFPWKLQQIQRAQ